ncbi:MAG: molybdopterin-dependent oxidoreductase, partial [Deltaproteobacteria bacterium]
FIAKRALNGNGGGKLSKNATRFRDSLPEGYEQNPDLQNIMEDIARKLRSSKKPVIVCGTDIVRESTPALAADVANLFCQVTEGAGLFYLLPGPNAFGAGLLCSESQSSALEAVESGKVKALVLVEQDPLWGCRDRLRMEHALNNLKQLIVLDYVPSSSAQKAHVVLPTTTLFERTAATFVNQEGRAQKTRPLHRGGTPLSLISGATHPPRTFLNEIPGGDPRAAHEVLSELYTALSGEAEGSLLKDLWGWAAEENAVFKAVISSPDGIRLVPEEISRDHFFTTQIDQSQPRKPGLELVLSDRTFGTEELSAYSRFARQGETPPRFFMHSDDAARLGLTEGEKTALYLERGEVVLELGIVSNMAAGVIVVPRHREVRWQKLEQCPAIVPDDRIRKI